MLIKIRVLVVCFWTNLGYFMSSNTKNAINSNKQLPSALFGTSLNRLLPTSCWTCQCQLLFEKFYLILRSSCKEIFRRVKQNERNAELTFVLWQSPECQQLCLTFIDSTFIVWIIITNDNCYHLPMTESQHECE